MDVRIYPAVFLGAALIAGSGICGNADPQSLLITVFQTGDAELARELLANTAVARPDQPGYHATTRTYGTDRLRPAGSFQQVRVIEGKKAHYSTRYRSPEVRFLWAEESRRGLLPNVGLVTEESESGFYVQAELHGNEVQLQLDRYNGQSRPEYTDTGLKQNIRTTVYGNLGDWLDAGGSLALDEEGSVNRGYILPRNNEEQTRLLIRVEREPR